MDNLVNIVNILVAISESTEELLEEHTTKVNSAGCSSCVVQVADVDLANGGSTRLFNLLSKRRQWNAHVVAAVLSGEVEAEVVIAQGCVV